MGKDFCFVWIEVSLGVLVNIFEMLGGNEFILQPILCSVLD